MTGAAPDLGYTPQLAEARQVRCSCAAQTGSGPRSNSHAALIRYAADPADIAQEPLFGSSGTGCKGSLKRRSPRPRAVKIRPG